ncbi:ABC transporter permease [Amnibacterium kyonggiense]|uniref:Osmoprotectant transport system permease protein n=1 Tax=Amnibacterium kyonggiense TaxID=595671 RepID=A0A4R7FME6_9MICO|nr:ABC transporter permease [Amnibacterium kyonggiense]TDS77642.1 osmoprotectant transport system permease protein [Amnibacterium kyonggiense]
MLFLQAIQWILDPEHWSEVNFQAGIAEELGDHLWLSFLAVVFTAAVALPIGLYIGHTGRGRGFAIVVANVVRAVPTLGLLSVLLLVSLTIPPAVFVFVLLGVPPLLAGAYAGLEAIDRQTIDASRAMGMTEWQILRRVELPLAAPLILGGLRGATLQIIASVTLVSNFGINSLGDFILGGLAANDYVQMTAGAILVTVLALLVDGLLAVLQRFATPRGVPRGRGASTARVRRLPVPNRAPVSEGN